MRNLLPTLWETPNPDGPEGTKSRRADGPKSRRAEGRRDTRAPIGLLAVGNPHLIGRKGANPAARVLGARGEATGLRGRAGTGGPGFPRLRTTAAGLWTSGRRGRRVLRLGPLRSLGWRAHRGDGRVGMVASGCSCSIRVGAVFAARAAVARAMAEGLCGLVGGRWPSKLRVFGRPCLTNWTLSRLQTNQRRGDPVCVVGVNSSQTCGNADSRSPRPRELRQDFEKY